MTRDDYATTEQAHAAETRDAAAAAAMLAGRWTAYESPFFRAMSRALDAVASPVTVQPVSVAALPPIERVTCGCGRRLVLGAETFGAKRECIDCYLGLPQKGRAA